MKMILKMALLVVLTVIATASGFFLFRIYQADPQTLGGQTQGVFPEITDLESGKLTSQPDIFNFFQAVAKEKGGAYAFDLLRQAPELTVDTHQIGHAIGEVLYQQEGIQGIRYCNNDFRNACSHSLVIDHFREHGEAGLPQLLDACRQLPGGFGDYSQCFHALGHGVLSYYGYDLPKTAAFCASVGTPELENRETKECIGGSIMEIVAGGAHDPTRWQKQRALYLNAEDPIQPCSQDFIPDVTKKRCYVYLTPHLIMSAGLTTFDPIKTDFSRAFSFCDKIDPTGTESRAGCYGGFGKEFLAFLQGGDVRSSGQESEQELAQLHAWCGQAGNVDGTSACVVNTLETLYWDGRNSHLTAIKFCEMSKQAATRSACFTNLIGITFTYVTNRSRLEKVCADIPEDFKRDCQSRLSS